MENFYYEFFTNNFTAEPLGAYSWQHILTTLICLIFFAGLAFLLYFLCGGGKNRSTIYSVTAIVLLSLEFIKFVVIIVTQGVDVWFFKFLPLRGNTVALIGVPFVAWLKGRGRQSRIWRDFTMLFGLMSGVGLFVFEAVFSVYPLWHFNTIIEFLTCGLAFFTAIYLLVSEDYQLNVASVKQCLIIAVAFIGIAYFVDALTGANYLHLKYPESTPFRLLFGIFHSSFWYTLSVAIVHLAYVVISSYVIALIRNAVYHRRRA